MMPTEEILQIERTNADELMTSLQVIVEEVLSHRPWSDRLRLLNMVDIVLGLKREPLQP